MYKRKKKKGNSEGGQEKKNVPQEKKSFFMLFFFFFFVKGEKADRIATDFSFVGSQLFCIEGFELDVAQGKEKKEFLQIGLDFLLFFFCSEKGVK